MERILYPHYTNVMREYPAKPNELKHVYDIKKDKYVSNEKHCCYYSPISNVEDYEWSSEDEDIITIDDDGLVEAKNIGTTKIKLVSPKDKEKLIGVIIYKGKPPKSCKKDYVYLEQGYSFSISEILKHGNCTHMTECLFENDVWDYYDEDLQGLIVRIREITDLMEDLENISDEYLNGSIIYHNLLDEYYIFNKYRVDGKIKIGVEVKSNFREGINKVISNLKIELRDLNRELFRCKR